MRKLFFAIFVIATYPSIAQSTWEFENTLELEKSKDLLYSQSKSFIADYWNSAQDVIQNDDKEQGIIQIKGITTFKHGIGLGVIIEYIYDYTVKIRVKDKKCRIEIYDVVCSDARQIGGSPGTPPYIHPFEHEPTGKTKSMGSGISKKKAVAMMVDLKANMNDIITSYEKYIMQPKDDF